MPSRRFLRAEQLGLDWNRAGAGRRRRRGRPRAAGRPGGGRRGDPRRSEPDPGLADSKVLSPAQREQLVRRDPRQGAVRSALRSAAVEEIDALNILQATLLAMRRAVDGLRLPPVLVLVDGNQLPVLRVRAEAIIDGDATVASISAASILAKVHRDRLCLRAARAAPAVRLRRTQGLCDARAPGARCSEHGACAAHRRSFAPVRETAARPGEPHDGRAARDQLARQPAAAAHAQAGCATPAATASSARSGSRASTCALRSRSAAAGRRRRCSARRLARPGAARAGRQCGRQRDRDARAAVPGSARSSRRRASASSSSRRLRRRWRRTRPRVVLDRVQDAGNVGSDPAQRRGVRRSRRCWR